MKLLRTTLVLAAIGLFTISMQSCKTKKAIAKPAPDPVEKPAPPAAVKEPAPAPEPKPAPAPVEEKPDYNFNKVYFEFDSGVLKTESFAVLDKIAAEMKKDASVKFILNGHSSVEGSAEHNMSLSVDRANSVKSYLVNAGVNVANLSIKGFGATQPAASNDAEEGRMQNRRVEFKVNQ